MSSEVAMQFAFHRAGRRIIMNVKDLKSAGLYFPYDELPDYIVEELKCRIADTVLALIGGALVVPENEAEELLKVINEGSGARTVWPLVNATSSENAAFVNGFHIRYADWGDTYNRRNGVGAGGHPSDMFAAIFALCDSDSISGKTMIELAHLGYNMYSVLQENMLYKRLDLDYTSSLGLIIPVLAAVLNGDSPEQIQNALNVSASSSVITEQVRPGDITNLKSGATAYAVSRAIWCYRFSSFLKAPASMFEGKFGWYNTVAELNGEFEAPEGYFPYETVQIKCFPSFNPAQGPVECAIKMNEMLGGKIAGIAGIQLRVNEKHSKKLLKPRIQYPTSMAEADHHIRYCVAAALKTGALSPLQYGDNYLQDEDIHKLIDITDIVKMDAEEEKELSCGKAGSSKLVITTIDGEELVASVSAPTGFLAGYAPDERVRELRRIVDMKRGMLEKTGGFDFGELFDKIFDLENISVGEMISAVRKAVGK